MLNVLGQLAIHILPFLAVLTLVITVHELGHYLAARAFKVKIDRFSLGFGRAIASRMDKYGTEWRLAWLPLGGYVKFAGDVDATGVPDQAGLDVLRKEIVAAEGPGAERQYFYFKPIWQRAIVVAGGPIANFVLAMALFTVLFSAVGTVIVPPRVAAVDAGTPAAAAGFQIDDLVTEVNGRPMKDSAALQRVVALSAGDRLEFTVERNGAEVALTGTPERVTVNDEIAGRITMARMGLGLAPNAGEARHIRYPPHEALWQGVLQIREILGTTMTYLGRIFTGKESGDQLSGPIGIAKVAGGITKSAAAVTEDPGYQALNVSISLLSFAAILSVGIGFLNLLPVPVLDGGHLLFYGYEAVARRPLSARVQEAGYRLGLVLLVGLMLFVTWNDLQKLSLFKFLGGPA